MKPSQSSSAKRCNEVVEAKDLRQDRVYVKHRLYYCSVPIVTPRHSVVDLSVVLFVEKFPKQANAILGSRVRLPSQQRRELVRCLGRHPVPDVGSKSSQLQRWTILLVQRLRYGWCASYLSDHKAVCLRYVYRNAMRKGGL